MYPFSLVLRVKRKQGFREVNSQPGARRVASLNRSLSREGKEDARKEEGEGGRNRSTKFSVFTEARNNCGNNIGVAVPATSRVYDGKLSYSRSSIPLFAERVDMHFPEDSKSRNLKSGTICRKVVIPKTGYRSNLSRYNFPEMLKTRNFPDKSPSRNLNTGTIFQSIGSVKLSPKVM